jgi:ubiquinone/menaquinone biosynthesis C-methylase UbiE
VDKLGPVHSRSVAGGREIEDVQAPRLGDSGAALPSGLLALLRCLECGAAIRLVSLSERPGYPELGPDGRLRCEGCGETYPLIAGTARMLPRAMRGRLALDYPLAHEAFDEEPGEGAASAGDDSRDVKQRTADSFAYEWQRFGALRKQWRKNFIDYMQPHSPESFEGRLVLDVGTGSGRHAFHAAELGARVVAVDIGRSIDVARGNLPPEVLTVQADAEHLPFTPGTFDFVMSIGVLHHLPDPQRGLERIAPLSRPGGHVHVYLYWVPEHAWHVRVLRLVSAARKVTVRLPHRLLHALCVPLAAMLALTVVWPYRALRSIPRLRWLAGAFPLKTYADYPFGVLVNDQFDRLSAPLERRYTRAEVLAMLEETGLTDVQVLANHGWVGDGRAATAQHTNDEVACL